MPKKPQSTERYTTPESFPRSRHQRARPIRMSSDHRNWATRAADWVRDYDPMATHGTSLDNPVKRRKR